MIKIERFINEKLLQDGLAKSFFNFMFIFLAANSIYNSLLAAFGAQYPLSTFLFNPLDRFADFFNVVFSYPITISRPINNSFLSDIFIDFSGSRAYGGINELLVGKNTHFHLPPLTTLFNLVSIFIAEYINIYSLFIFYFSLLTLFLFLLINEIIDKKEDKKYIFIGLFLSYPFLFLLSRGNLYSYITFICLIYYIFLVSKNKYYLALTALSIAVNIRPNTVIFLLFLLCSVKSNFLKFFIYFAILSIGVFFGSLEISNYFYQDYTIKNFLVGLENYYKIYVDNFIGMPYGSSLQSVSTIIFRDNFFAKTIPIVMSSIILIIGIYAYLKDLISKSTYLYILCCICMLTTSVFGDYHLLIFIAPVLVLYQELKSSQIKEKYTFENIVVFLGCIICLVPKNYIFSRGISAQVIINPLLTCVMLASLYWNIFRRKI